MSCHYFTRFQIKIFERYLPVSVRSKHNAAACSLLLVVRDNHIGTCLYVCSNFRGVILVKVNSLTCNQLAGREPPVIVVLERNAFSHMTILYTIWISTKTRMNLNGRSVIMHLVCSLIQQTWRSTSPTRSLAAVLFTSINLKIFNFVEFLVHEHKLNNKFPSCIHFFFLKI